jgi:hypothetical protein
MTSNRSPGRRLEYRVIHLIQSIMKIGWHAKRESKITQESRRGAMELLHFQEHYRDLGTFLRKLVDPGGDEKADDQMPFYSE